MSLVPRAGYSRELEVGSNEGQSEASPQEGGHTQGDTDTVLGSGLEGHCVRLEMEGGKVKGRQEPIRCERRRPGKELVLTGLDEHKL
jgi:hypothetical protein